MKITGFYNLKKKKVKKKNENTDKAFKYQMSYLSGPLFLEGKKEGEMFACTNIYI